MLKSEMTGKEMIENIINDNEFSLLRLMPAVLRARDYRLYTNSGQRLVDLWLNGGAAILGHNPSSMLKELKNTASRGLYAPFPHFLEGRYIRALARIIPGRVFRLYAAPPPELEALITQGIAVLWRPFFTDDSENNFINKAPVLVPVIPGIQGWRSAGGSWLPLGLCVLAVDPGLEKSITLPPGDFISPVLLSAAARGIHDIIAAGPQRAKPSFPRIEKVLKNNGKTFWQCRGIYLTPRQVLSPEEWTALFRRFLEAGYLLPPVSSHPLILPGILSPGEEVKLAGLLKIDHSIDMVINKEQ